MKMTKKSLATAIAVTGLAMGTAAPAAQAVDLSASVGVANMYYWRGFDLGGGAAVSGELMVSGGGAYGGMWTSSGDGEMGTEYDLFVGYGQEFGNFSFDISAWSYSYPLSEVQPGDWVEIVLGLGFGPVSVNYYHGMEDLEDYSYFTADVAFGDFGVLVGHHMEDDAGIDGYTHLDLSYAFNDNISFTLGLVADAGEGDLNDEPKFLVSYSLPIEF